MPVAIDAVDVGLWSWFRSWSEAVDADEAMEMDSVGFKIRENERNEEQEQ